MTSRTKTKPEGPRRTSTLSAFVWMLTGTAVQTVVRIGVIAVLARLLAPADFGLVTAAAVIIGFAEIFSEVGVRGSIVQLREIERRHIHTGVTLSLAVGLALAVLLFAAAPLIAGLLRLPRLAELIPVMCLLFPISALGVTPTGLLARELGFRAINLINVAAYVFGYSLFAIVGASLGMGVWALVLGTLALEAIKTGLLLMVRPQGLRPGWSTLAAKELGYLGSGFTVARIGNYLATQGDNLVVARALGATAVGFYSRAYQLAAMPATLVGQMLDDVLFSSFARSQDDDEASRRMLSQAVAFVAWATMPLAALMVVLAEEIVLILLGGQWGGAVETFRILSAAVFLRVGYKMSDALTRGRGAVYQRAAVQWFYAAVVIGGAAFAQRWGVTGVAWAVAAALLLNYGLMSMLTVRLLKFGWGRFLALHGHGLALALLAAPLAFGVRELALGHNLPGIARLVAVTAVTGISCALAALVLPAVFLGPDNRATLATIWTRTVRRLKRRGPAT